MGTAPPTVSFVVIARNEAATITAALGSILAQRVDKEIVVVDDCSRDRTPELVAELASGQPGIRLIRLPGNRGRGFARHTGVTAARGRLVATVDADVILPETWWERCAEALATADAVAGTAVPDGDVAYLYRRFSLSPRRRTHTTPVTASNALYRCEVFACASFDPLLRDGEDVALGHELTAAGARLRTVPGLFVEHRDHRTFTEAVVWLFQSGRGATRQLWRYRKLRLPDLAAGGMLATIGWSIAERHRGPAAALWPAGAYLALAASAHVASAFAWEWSHRRRLLAGVVVDMPLLAAYFGGRVAGLASLATAGWMPRR